MKRITSFVYTFEELRNGDFLYVDKTESIWRLIQSTKEGYFLSRPRRFGKSLMISTLKAIFEGRRELFDGLAISKKEYDWKPYPVIHLDMGNCSAKTPKALEGFIEDRLCDIAAEHGVTLRGQSNATRFESLISALGKQEKVVILIDEYDKPILNNVTNPEADAILSVLKGFYSTVKTCEDLERFVFITGVTKFCHVSLFSDLNNLTDITMRSDYATMFGYTQSELEHYFSDRIKATARAQKISEEELKRKLKTGYDGYCFEETSETVYNPVSIAKFFENDGKLDNYWFATGTPSFLMELAK